MRKHFEESLQLHKGQRKVLKKKEKRKKEKKKARQLGEVVDGRYKRF